MNFFLFYVLQTLCLAASWGGINSPHLHTLPLAARTTILDAIVQANLKTVRIFIGPSDGSNGGVVVGDVETTLGFDDSVLNLVDQLMVECNARSIKLIIALHDRWENGCMSTSVYMNSTLYGAVATQAPNCVLNGRLDDNNFHLYKHFYGNAAASYRYILNHPNALMENQMWGNLTSVVAAVEVENEVCIGPEWTCRMAQFAKLFLNPSILVSNGGGSDMFESSLDNYFMCPDLDIVSLHHFGNVSAGVVSQMVAKAARTGTKLLAGEFGCSAKNSTVADRASCDGAIIDIWKSAGVPWMLWEVAATGDGERVVGPSDPVWTILGDKTKGFSGELF